jgi:precorrin-4/cobalt-precorrin-4 C11-methyltransferase
MKVYFVGAGPGDPELLTRKAEKLLRGCAVCIYAGSLVSPEVVAMVSPAAEKHNSAAMDLSQIMKVYLAARDRHLDVVRLHTGDPSLYGAINEQMDELDRHGIDYEVVPGVSAFQAAAAALKRELTAPEVVQTVILSRAGGRTPVPEAEALENLARTKATLCLYLSIHQIEVIARSLATQYGTDCPAAVVFHASWPDQQVLTGTLADIAAKTTAAGITKTALILVGRSLAPVGALGGTRSKLYDSGFSHAYRKAGDA